jgi:carbon-monoxide dehydrogenase medium subunit
MSKANDLFRPAEYFKPTTIKEAVELLLRYGEKGKLIAGGTDLLIAKDPQIEALIDITGLGLSYIKSDSQGLRIGAATVFADIETSLALSTAPYYIIAKAAHKIGTPQIRNLGTIGGNICNAVPSADSASVLLVLDATLNISGPSGEKSMGITDFFKDVRKNALGEGELLTEIRVPTFPAYTGTVFIKKGRVAAADLSVVNVAVRLTMTPDNICQDVRIALGAVAPTPLRAKEAEAMLRGKKSQETLLEQVAACAAKETQPISDVRSSAEYRRTLSRVLVERALKEGTAEAFTR